MQAALRYSRTSGEPTIKKESKQEEDPELQAAIRLSLTQEKPLMTEDERSKRGRKINELRAEIQRLEEQNRMEDVKLSKEEDRRALKREQDDEFNEALQKDRFKEEQQRMEQLKIKQEEQRKVILISIDHQLIGCVLIHFSFN